METERGHMSVRRGVSWSPGGGRKPLQGGHSGNTDTGKRESDASLERRDYKGIKGQVTSTSTNQLARKTSKFDVYSILALKEATFSLSLMVKCD